MLTLGIDSSNIRARTRWIGDFKTIYVTGGARIAAMALRRQKEG